MVQAPLFRSGQAFGGLLTHLRLDRTRNVVNEKPLRIGPSLPPQKTHMEITAIIQAGPGYFTVFLNTIPPTWKPQNDNPSVGNPEILSTIHLKLDFGPLKHQN